MRERDSFKGRRGKIWGEGKGSEWEKVIRFGLGAKILKAKEYF